MEGPGLPGGSIHYQGHLLSQKGHLCRRARYPYYWEKLPKYPQSEMYQKALGQHSLPAEQLDENTIVYLRIVIAWRLPAIPLAF